MVTNENRKVIVTVLAAALFFAVPFNVKAEEISRFG